MSDILEPYMSNSNPTLEHHGVLGMRWGHRKGKMSSVSNSMRRRPKKSGYGKQKAAVVGKTFAKVVGSNIITNAIASPMIKSGHYITAGILAAGASAYQFNAVLDSISDYAKVQAKEKKH